MGVLHRIYEENFKELIETLSEEQLDKIDASLMDALDEHINEEHIYTIEFTNRLNEQWGETFKLSKALSIISLESLEAFF